MQSDTAAFWKIWNKSNRSVHNNDFVSEINPCDFVSSFKNNLVESSDNVNMVNQYTQCYSNYCNSDVNMLSFTVEDIEQACRKLSDSNCFDCNNLTVKHFLYAHPSVFVWLKDLFNSMLAHGFVPDGFGSNFIVPVIKKEL
jgi:hypothetical protein